MDETLAELLTKWVLRTQGIALDPERVSTLVADFERANRIAPTGSSVVEFEDEPSWFFVVLTSNAELGP